MPAQIGLPLRNRRGRQLCVERLEKVRLTDIDLLELRMTYRFEIRDRKSTRLNSSHGYISYAVFCLKKNNLPRQSRRQRPVRDLEGARLPRPMRSHPASLPR